MARYLLIKQHLPSVFWTKQKLENLGVSIISMRKTIFALIIMSVFALLISAQTPTGSLRGVVSGPDGVLQNATVVAKFNATGKTQTVVSGSDGAFTFAQLEPGLYTVTVSSKGFKTYVGSDVKVDIGRDYNLAPVLEIGNVEESVTVTAGADVVTSSSAQVTSTVSPQQILSLPLITRDPLNLTTLQAGTASNPFQGTSINGLRTTQTNITRDGISINDGFIRSNATDFAPGRPSVDDTGEFTISTSNQESDSGSGGAQIKLVTPRGTKDYHGALFAYNRNSHFAANNFFNNRSGVVRPFRNRNQFGGKVGGQFPLLTFGEGKPTFLKDRAFFFFAYEGVRDPVTASANRTVLNAAARSGAFSFRRATAGDPSAICPSGAAQSICTISNLLAYGRANLAGGASIPLSIDPIIQARVLNVSPSNSNNSDVGDGLNTGGFRFNRNNSLERKTYTSRFDIDATEKDAINVVFSWNYENVQRPDVDVATFGYNPDVTQYSKNKTFTIAYRRIFSSNIVNEARYGIFTSEVPFARVSKYPSYFIGPAGTTSGTLAGIISSPDNVFLDQGRFNKGFTAADNVDWIAGKHTIRFGGQLQFQKVNSYNDVLIVPNYNIGTTNVSTATNTTFTTANFVNVVGGVPTTGSVINTTSLGTANGLLALLGGLVNSASQGFNTASPTSGYQVVRNLAPYRNQNHALYAQDRWNVARGLTLSLGVRWEVYPALKLANGLALEPILKDLKNPESTLLDPTSTFGVIGSNSGKQYTYYKTDLNNFAPSIGVAYTPNFGSGIGKFFFGGEGKTVFRGGYSQIFGNDSIITSLSGTLAGNVGLGRATGSAIGPAGSTALNDRLSGTLTAITPPAFVPLPRTFLQNNTATQGFFGVANVVNPYLQIPKTEQYSIGFQREFLGNMALEIRYVGSRSNSLSRGVDLNEIDIVKNGFLDDFKRAQANLALPGATTPFCTAATVGCQPLTIFRSTIAGTTIGSGPIVVGGALTSAAFNTSLQNGTVADLARSIIGFNLNNHPSVASPNNVPFVKFLPNPATGSINYFTNSGYFNYNSLQVELRRRFSQGLYLQANYTFSKNLTNAIGTSQGLNEPFLQNQNQDLDIQRADFDATHVFNFNGIYQLPFGKGKWLLNHGGVIDKIFGGFEISGIVQSSTGAPISFVDTRGTLNIAGRSGRQTPNSSLTNAQIQALSGVFEANGNIYFINPSILNTNGQASTGYITPLNTANNAFAGQVFYNVSPGQTGNVARTLLNGPRQFNVNASLLKNIKFTESIRVQLRAEAFNLFNNVNFFNNTQFANINSTTFGRITSAGAARQLQFAARFEF
jgi:Carboxypeptidase regulatory-like domain/TonB dependent receptor